MSSAACFTTLTVLLLANLTPCQLTDAFPPAPIEALQGRIKRESLFGGVKQIAKTAIHNGKEYLDNAQDSYDGKKLRPIDYANAEKFCRSIGEVDPSKNRHCVEDLTHNFLTGSVLSLFGGGRNTERPSGRNSESAKHGSSSTRHKERSRDNNDVVVLRKRLRVLVLNLYGFVQNSDLKAAAKEVEDISKIIEQLRKREQKDD